MFDPSQTAAQCPFHQTDQAVSGLTGSEELVLPVNKRAIIQYSHDDSGTPELHIYYDDKEIAFDEPELFAFGEALAKQTLFKASSATTWGGGQAIIGHKSNPCLSICSTKVFCILPTVLTTTPSKRPSAMQ